MCFKLSNVEIKLIRLQVDFKLTFQIKREVQLYFRHQDVFRSCDKRQDVAEC